MTLHLTSRAIGHQYIKFDIPKLSEHKESPSDSVVYIGRPLLVKKAYWLSLTAELGVMFVAGCHWFWMVRSHMVMECRLRTEQISCLLFVTS